MTEGRTPRVYLTEAQIAAMADASIEALARPLATRISGTPGEADGLHPVPAAYYAQAVEQLRLAIERRTKDAAAQIDRLFGELDPDSL
jgi:hypothetical protein